MWKHTLQDCKIARLQENAYFAPTCVHTKARISNKC